MQPEYPQFVLGFVSWIIIGLVALVSILLITYGFHILDTTLTNWPMVSISHGGNTSNNQTSNSTINTSNWINYTNHTYGFSLMYPNGWKLSETTINNQTKIIISTRETVAKMTNLAYQIDINTNPLDETLSAEQSKLQSSSNYKEAMINFAGQNATQITYTRLDTDKKEWGEKEIIFGQNKQTFVISGITSDPVKTGGIDLGVFDSINSSWKFI